MDVDFFQVEGGTDQFHETDMQERLMLSADERAILERRSRAPVIPKRPEPDSAPLSFAQRQIWLIDQMFPDNPAYNVPVGYRLKGSLDVSALEDGFNEIIRRHEGLRTTFAVNDGEPRQHIHPECTIKIHITELDSISLEEGEQRLCALALEESVTPFDLSRLPLIRVSLFKLDDAEHVLLVNCHHIVTDGGSIRLMMDELDTFYRVFTGTGSGRPRDLTIQYPDYALWQRDTLANKNDAGQIAFWRKQLHGRLPVLELPGDLRRPPVQSFNGSNVFLDIPTALAQDLTALGAREGCTFFTTVLAAFQVLLHRYSGAEDFLIGTPVAVRPRSELGTLIGNFLNMIALRCDLSGHPTFVQVLRRTRRMTLRAFGKAELPFEKIVESLSLERDLSRNPIFQVMLEVMPAVTPHIGNLQVSTFYFDLGYAQFDLSLHVCEETDSYVSRFEYCRDLFKADTIERLASNFGQLLHEIVRNPEQEISKIPILTEAEKRRVLEEWNSTSCDYAQDRCLHHLVEQTASTAPDRAAVEYAGRTLTYAEVNAQANRVAHALIELGVKREELVGVYLERSLDLVIALLGVLKAGAAYVPMDPAFPQDRLTFMIEDAGISVLVTQTDLLAALPPSSRKAICLDRDRATLQQQRSSDPGLPLHPSSLAYTIYTSGSTGRPKGVMIEHRSVVNFLTSMQLEPGFDEHDVLVAVTTISFDIAVLEMFLPLVSGGKLVIAGKNEVIDGALLRRLMERSGVTTLQATPSTWKLLLDANWPGIPGLKMLCGGEALPRELANRLLERGAELWNMYGPTETTIWSSVQRVEPGEGPVLIGHPITNTQFYIVDRELEPVPIGVAGELLIGGHGVSRGYLNRPDLSAERFVAKSLLGAEGRVYRTGDLAKFHADGRTEFLGRLDLQVKVRGYRIELEEIEYVLAQHDGVKDVAVVTREDPDGDQRLVAYYIPSPGKQPTVGDLRKHLQEKLPDYMIPSFFAPLHTFPCTPNGKVDRKAFPGLETSALRRDSRYVAPRRELEVQLVALWQDALKRRPIGIDDNFFELGGHSLLAARMFVQIEKHLGVNLPLAILFRAPTIRQMAENIEQGTWKSSWNSLVPIQTQGNRPPLFLIHGAEGNVLLYRHLARKLGNSQPLYGLQSRGLDGCAQTERSIENMAAKYLEEIKSVQTEGPYYLGGYCLGGTIALEIAQQLRRGGEPVALLAMFETYNVKAGLPISFSLRTFHKAQNLYFQIRNLFLSLAAGSIRFFVEKFEIEFSRFKDMCLASILKRVNPSHRPQYQHLQVRVANHEAQAAYCPTPYDGRIHLFRPKAHYREFNDLYFGWGMVARQGVQVVDMPNYPRGSLNDPFVEVLAQELGAEIEKCLMAHELNCPP